MTEEYLYRLVDSGYTDQPPQMRKLCIIRKTPGGQWCCDIWCIHHFRAKKETAELRQRYGARFILNGTGRRYAYPTEELARDSYRIRKQRQIQHARNAIESAERALKWLETGELPTPEFFAFEIGGLHD